MVFYTKLPFLRRYSLFKLSYIIKWKEFYERLIRPTKLLETKPIYIFDKNSKVQDWTFVNDKIFGGSSNSKLIQYDDSCNYHLFIFILNSLI